jgi:hypothetical protein
MFVFVLMFTMIFQPANFSQMHSSPGSQPCCKPLPPPLPPGTDPPCKVGGAGVCT